MSKKGSFKRFIKIFSVVFLSGILFLSIVFSYFKIDENSKESTADTKDLKVPYSVEPPDNKGLVFVYPDNTASLIFFDFEEEKIFLGDIESFEKTDSYFGYPIDSFLNLNYDVISEMIDKIGGVELENEGETLRYSGTQVINLISKSTDTSYLRKNVLASCFKTLSKNGVCNSDIVYLIQNSETDLSVADCLNWISDIKEMSRRTVSINF